MARRHWMLLAGIVAFGLASLLAPPGRAEEPKDKIERPERGISMHTEYSRVTIPAGEKVRMDLTIDNLGKHDENVLVNLVSVPRGWKAGVKGGQYEVSGVPVEATKTRVLSFTAEPEKGLRPGAYTFQIDGATADHALKVSQTLVVTTQERKAGTAACSRCRRLTPSSAAPPTRASSSRST